MPKCTMQTLDYIHNDNNYSTAGVRTLAELGLLQDLDDIDAKP